MLKAQKKAKKSNVSIECPGMRSKKQKTQESQEDSRVCWRGKYYPKELMISDEKAREAMMIPRSSKLVVGQQLSALTALAEIKYLQVLPSHIQKALAKNAHQ